MKTLALLMFVLLVSACGGEKKIEGTYENASIGRSLTFHPNGIVFSNTNGIKIDEGPYSIKGDQIHVFKGPVLTLMKDGSIDAGAGYGKLTKK